MTTLSPRPDREIVAQVLARDRKAAAEFVESFADDIYSFVWYRLAPKVESVDDLVQETFLAAWTNLPSYSGEAPLRQWLLSIARHKVNDHYRRALRWTWDTLDEESPLPDDAESIEALLVAEEVRERVVDVLSELRPEQAVLRRWRYWDLQSAKEMAEQTGKSEKAIERMLARARQEFRARWAAPNVKDGKKGAANA